MVVQRILLWDIQLRQQLFTQMLILMPKSIMVEGEIPRKMALFAATVRKLGI